MKVKFLVLAALCFLFGLKTNAQLNPAGVAPGLVYHSYDSYDKQVFVLQKSIETLKIEDEQGISGIPYRIGYAIPVYSDLFELGEWIEMEDGRKFFRVSLHSPGAKALNVAFDDFYLPENAQLFFYDSDKSFVYGGYTHHDNHESGMFPGPVIEGDNIIIEYFEPESEKVNEPPVLQVKDLMYYYRSLDFYLKNQNIGASDDCHVNVNCPEGDEWQDEKRGIARILLRVGNSAGWCSGSLINNTAQDGTPYFLTAEHCGSGASSADHNLWQFRFNFERPGCEDAGIPANQVITGSSPVAIAPMDGGSDLRLLKLNFTPPASFQPYYNGWDRSVIPAASGVCIHHPAGDVKKISTFVSTASNVANPVISGISMAANSAWNIIFVATETGHSVTEGGSSGSPMFNENKLIVGSLTGGNSSCSNPSGSNIFGKFNYHWESYGDTADTQLKHWLDPLGTGQLTLNGLDIYPIPKIKELSGMVNEDYTVSLKWYKPEYTIEDNWYSHVAAFSSVRHEMPERATSFNFQERLDIDTFYLKKLSHLFWQHPNFPWGANNTFTFKVFDHDAATLLYESEVLTALNFQTTNKAVFHELPEQLALSNDFFVAIAPVNSGQPSSLSLEVSDTTNSYFGSAGNWQVLEDDGKYYELLINVYGSVIPTELDTDNEKESEFYPGNLQDKLVRLGSDYSSVYKAVANIQKGSDGPVDKVLMDIIYFNIYRDDNLIGSTDSGSELEFLDDSPDLIQGETYKYSITSVINLNPANPNSPLLESEKSDEIILTLIFVSDNEIVPQHFSVFPNPNSGKFSLSLPETDKYNKVQIINSHGQIITTRDLTGQMQANFDLTGMSPGIYYLLIFSNDQMSSKKIIVR